MLHTGLGRSNACVLRVNQSPGFAGQKEYPRDEELLEPAPGKINRTINIDSRLILVLRFGNRVVCACFALQTYQNDCCK